MSYQRKTRDVYTVQGYYGPTHGWEDVCTEDTRAEARQRLKEYRENDPHPHRLVRRREKITPTTNPTK